MTMMLNGVEINLKKIGIDFIPNSDQIAALEHLAKFMESDPKFITTVLSGGAGVGKTSIVKIFLAYVKEKYRVNIRLIAPTHKAKAVLSRLSPTYEALTLHKLLGLKPNFNILEFDAKAMQFLDTLNLPLFDNVNELIIVDECSMINNELYDLLISKVHKSKGRIVFIGDHKQIAPVKQGEVSKVFTKTMWPGFTLTKVERQQNNPLLKTLVRLRADETFDLISEINETMDKGIGVHNMVDFKFALSEAFFSLEHMTYARDNKILAYTNDRVKGFNDLARRMMGAAKNAINQGEILMGYDTYCIGYQEVLFNGSEYIVDSFRKGNSLIPHYGLFPGYYLRLMDLHTDEVSECFLLDPDAPKSSYDNLATVIEHHRLKAIKRKYLWKNYFAINESFITMRDIVFEGRVIRKKTVDYGYAMTVHKSQSSTYKNVFVDLDNINLCRDPNERKQLKYVALSRPTHFAHILKK